MTPAKNNYYWEDGEGGGLTFTRFNDPPGVILTIDDTGRNANDFFVRHATPNCSTSKKASRFCARCGSGTNRRRRKPARRATVTSLAMMRIRVGPTQYRKATASSITHQAARIAPWAGLTQEEGTVKIA